MNADWILGALLRANLAASAAVLLTLTLRPLVNRVLGARAVYRLWLLVPIMVLAVFLPAPMPVNRANVAANLPATEHRLASEDYSRATIVEAARSSVETAATWVATTRSQARLPDQTAAPLLDLWMAGAVLLFVRALVRSRKVAADPRLGPALIGVLRPKLVLPRDFTTRFDAREQTLVLAHEGVHRASGHVLINALVELGRCANWVNPLAHVAAFCARADQELSCDAAVIARFPGERRIYGRALLKTQITDAIPPLGCAWPGRSSGLLRERIEMLARRLPGRSRTTAGIIFVAALVAGGGYAAWAAQPRDQPASTTADAQRPLAAARAELPAGLLTALERKRHELFTTRAAAGHIDVVFIGDSEVDFWRYDNSGKQEWNRSYAPLRAVNFGVEGAHTRSVLWRLRNGELEGIQPKVVVLSPLGVADAANHGLEVSQIIAGNKAIIAEIRKRQPQARILVIALPRGQPTNLSRQVMRPVDDELAKLADNRTIYYVDLYAQFLAPDGTLASNLYVDGLGQVLNPRGYTVWSQAMNPKLEELLRP